MKYLFPEAQRDPMSITREVQLQQERRERIWQDLERTKPGDTLTYFNEDDSPSLYEVFSLARTFGLSLVGYEFTVETHDGVKHRKLVGHFCELGGDDSTIAPWDARLVVRAARKVWLP